MPDITMKRERTDRWTKMRLSRSSGTAASCHMLSSVDCITTTSESEFSVHTGVKFSSSSAILPPFLLLRFPHLHIDPNEVTPPNPNHSLLTPSVVGVLRRYLDLGVPNHFTLIGDYLRFGLGPRPADFVKATATRTPALSKTLNAASRSAFDRASAAMTLIALFAAAASTSSR
jgi:hypothetical protein